MKKLFLAWLFIILFAQLFLSIFALPKVIPSQHLLLEKQPTGKILSSSLKQVINLYFLIKGTNS